MSKLSGLQGELAEAEENVQVCNDMLALDPGNADALETKALQEEVIADVKAQIAAETAKSAPPPPPPTDNAAPPPPPPKYDMSKHPKFRDLADAAPPPPPEEQVFDVKDTVLAKWSEDKQWYPATIISKTGSSHDPVYTVTFKGYNNTETKRKHEIRPTHNPHAEKENKKRKADVLSPAVPAPPTPASPTVASNDRTGHVISAAPAVDRSLVPSQPPQKYIPSKVSDGPTRMAPEPKKLKGQKQLQKNQSNWQAWAAGGPKKAGAMGAMPKKKDSMFRTPDAPGAKVGFTGSGKGMSKDQDRRKWQYGSSDAQEE